MGNSCQSKEKKVPPPTLPKPGAIEKENVKVPAKKVKNTPSVVADQKVELEGDDRSPKIVSHHDIQIALSQGIS